MSDTCLKYIISCMRCLSWTSVGPQYAPTDQAVRPHEKMVSTVLKSVMKSTKGDFRSRSHYMCSAQKQL